MNTPDRKTILLVETESFVAIAEAKTIESFGYIVVHAKTGEAAVEIAISNERISLVLMDIDLGSGIDGPEATRRILEKRNIPIVFLTSHTEPEYVDKVKKITRYGYVIKNSGDFVLQSSIEMAYELFEAHSKAKENELLYLLTLESFPNTSILLFDREFRYRLTSGDEIKKSGFDKSKIIGKTLRESYPPAVVELFEPLYEKALRGEKSSFEMEYSDMVYYQQVIPVRDLNGNVCNGMVIAHNITQRKRAEEALKESEESLSITLQSIGDAVIATDIEGRITRMNDTAERLTGWNFNDALGRPLDEVFTIINAETRSAVENPVHKVLETGKTIGLANHSILVGCDKTEYHIADSAAPIRDREGKVKGVILVFSDITEKYRAAEKLKESRNFYQGILDHIVDGVWVSDQSDIIFYANNCMEKITGISSESIKNVNVLTGFPETTLKFFRPYYLKAKDTLQPVFYDAVQVITPSGRNSIQSGWLIPRIKNGIYDGMICTVQDVTERYNAEKELIRLKECAETANRVKSLFLANMNHELRTPLNGVIGFTDLLSASELNERQSEFVQMIKISSMHLYELIEDLLDYSRLEVKKIVLEKKPFDIRMIVKYSQSLIYSQLINKNLELEIYIDPEITYILMGDQLRIKQILLNLLTNAIKFSSSGTIRISATQIFRDFNTAKIALSVSDEGIGIQSDKSEEIFELFHQLDESNTRRYGGTGLGLSIVKGLVELMGGTISVKSEFGKGSCFTIEISFEISRETDDKCRSCSLK